MILQQINTSILVKEFFMKVVQGILLHVGEETFDISPLFTV